MLRQRCGTWIAFLVVSVLASTSCSYIDPRTPVTEGGPNPTEAQARYEEAIKKFGIVRGRVMTPDGKPVANLSYICTPLFRLKRPDPGVSGPPTNDQGEYECVREPGQYRLDIYSKADTITRQVELKAGSPITLDITVPSQ